jgi:hypothetical protein
MVVMLVLQKEAMVLIFTQMGFQYPVDHFEDFIKFFSRHFPDEVLHQGVIRKFLQIIDDSVLIGIPVHTESDQTRIRFDKLMGMLVHDNVSFIVKTGFRSQESEFRRKTVPACFHRRG